MTGNRKLLAASQMVYGAQLRRKSDAVCCAAAFTTRQIALGVTHKMQQ